VRVAGEGVQDQDRVGSGRIQFAVGFVGYVNRSKRDAAIEQQRIETNDLGLNNHRSLLSIVPAALLLL
jgi:hypothetical protein